MRGVALETRLNRGLLLFVKAAPDVAEELFRNRENGALLFQEGDVYCGAIGYAIKDKARALELAKKFLALTDRVLPAGFEETLKKEIAAERDLQLFLGTHFDGFKEELPEYLHVNLMEWGFDVVLNLDPPPTLPEEGEEE